jgi:hypothetical protein
MPEAETVSISKIGKTRVEIREGIDVIVDGILKRSPEERLKMAEEAIKAYGGQK